MSVTFDPNTGQYTNSETGFSSSDGADPGLSGQPSGNSGGTTPSGASNGFMSPTAGASGGGGNNATGAPTPEANALIANGGIGGANLSDPNQLAQTGVAASQTTTPPYNTYPSLHNAPSSPTSGSVPGGAVNELTAQQQSEAINPAAYLANHPELQFQYQPIDPNAPGTQLNYNPIGEGVTAPTNLATASTIPGARNPGTSTYNAALTGAATDADISDGARVQNQLRDILGNNDAEGNNVPLWAQPAVTESRQAMNSMGLGNSTMAASAMEAAILKTALPMAQQNAAERAQLDQQNLANRQQSLLSNQAAMNAAKQFNAQSVNQNVQFFNSLNVGIAEQNAQRQTAISQFNSGQVNSMTQFITNLNSQRAEFNAQNQLLVDQSNVQWRRAVNTANTAGVNAANQANVQNAFNLSQTAQNQLWQQSADEASWALTSGENSQNRLLSLVNSALNRQTSLQILESQLRSNMFSQLGGLATNLFNGAGGLSGIFGSGSGGGADNGPDIEGINSFGGGSDLGAVA